MSGTETGSLLAEALNDHDVEALFLSMAINVRSMSNRTHVDCRIAKLYNGLTLKVGVGVGVGVNVGVDGATACTVAVALTGP